MKIVIQSVFIKWFVILIYTCVMSLFIVFPFVSISSISFAIALNFFLMIWISIFESLVRPALKCSYFDSKKIEREGHIYKYFGVHFYRKILVISGWERERKVKTPIKKKIDALEYFEYRTRASEFGHGIIAIIISFVSMYICITHSFKEAIGLIVLNIVLNIYPIMVQRYNRPRVQRVIKKLKSQSTRPVN